MTNIAILGFGVVGGGVADVITKNNETIARKTGEHIHIKYILDLREFPDHPLGNRVFHDINIILSDPEVTVVA
ncbi:MAG: homoserine dehydrogenase, partial [Eubacteriales bacterium]